MITQESGLIVYLIVSLCSLIVVHRWFPINSYGGYSHGDGGGGSVQSADHEKGTFTEEDELLTCDHLKEMTRISVIGEGAVKVVWLVKWRGHPIALSELRDIRYQEDFNHNRMMLQKLSLSGKVVKLLGICNQTIILTQFHPFGSPLNLLVWNHRHRMITRTSDCFKLCLQFVDLINYLHTHPSGPLVMCDSNSLTKLLSQMLISLVDHDDTSSIDNSLLANDLKLIVNDLDALPTVQKGKGIKCGSRRLVGTFVAPEQLWPYPDKSFNDSLMPPYDEKIDIWKIPDVCSWFIELSPNSQQLTRSLEDIHGQCKQRDPKLRPNSSTVYRAYWKVYQQLLIDPE